MPGLVAVTGATGFIGNALVRALIRDDWHVRALARRPQVKNNRLQWVTGDLQNKDALCELVNNVDIIIHCAGQVRGRSQDQFLQTNKVGTENIIRAALAQAKKPRFLLISSLSAREPQVSWYANSKYQGEQVLKALGKEIQWTIFRPTAVYGPGDRELVPLLKITKTGLLPMIGASNSRFGLIYIDDLVQAIIGWKNSTNVAYKTYELDDGTSGGYDRYLVKSIASRTWGHSVHIVSFPLMLAKGLAWINLGISRIFCYLPMLMPGKICELTHDDWVCNNHPLTKDIGWQPKITLSEGLPRAVMPSHQVNQ